MKTCTKCGEEKPLIDFYKTAKIRDGRESECKECHRGRVRKYYQNNKRKCDASHLAWRKNNLAKHREAVNRANDRAHKRYPERYVARYKLRNAVASGCITKPTICEGCGRQDNQLHGHHHMGYDRPLVVQWLCRTCHVNTHR